MKKVGCLPVPCNTCPYRRDVPPGIWDKTEYAKLVEYDAETWNQPAKLFMCHQNNGGLCTGWVQSHSNRGGAFDLLALRLLAYQLDWEQVSKVAMTKPLVKLFRSGAKAMRHGLKTPTRRAIEAIRRIARKRRRKTGVG